MQDLKYIEINNLTIERVEIDIVGNKLVVYCLDSKTYKKTYFKDFNDFKLNQLKTYEEKIIYVMKYGERL
nr:hypothetical protein [Pseudodesulfovibrio sp.]